MFEEEETEVPEEQSGSPYQQSFSPEHSFVDQGIADQRFNFTQLCSMQSSAASMCNSTPTAAHSFSPPSSQTNASSTPDIYQQEQVTVMLLVKRAELLRIFHPVLQIHQQQNRTQVWS